MAWSEGAVAQDVLFVSAEEVVGAWEVAPERSVVCGCTGHVHVKLPSKLPL